MRELDLSENHTRDRLEVEALSNPNHLAHDAAWIAWRNQVARIIRAENLEWSQDPSIDLDDLVQVALAEIARALPSFRYQSRLSTWVYGVVVRRINRYRRDRNTQKRTGNPASLDSLSAEIELPAIKAEDLVFMRLLLTDILTILADEPDQRLTKIFWMVYVEDTHIEEIARHFKLHPSRIRTLLKRLRELLKANPQLRMWLYEVQANPGNHNRSDSATNITEDS